MPEIIIAFLLRQPWPTPRTLVDLPVRITRMLRVVLLDATGPSQTKRTARNEQVLKMKRLFSFTNLSSSTTALTASSPGVKDVVFKEIISALGQDVRFQSQCNQPQLLRPSR